MSKSRTASDLQAEKLKSYRREANEQLQMLHLQVKGVKVLPAHVIDVRV